MEIKKKERKKKKRGGRLGKERKSKKRGRKGGGYLGKVLERRAEKEALPNSLSGANEGVFAGRR